MSRTSGVAERIRLQVLQGRFAPGDRLPELELQQELGIGGGTLAAALRRLEGRGLLEADEAGGMRVVALGGPALAEAVRTRAALETLAAELAAQRLAEAPDGSGGAATPAGGARPGDAATPRAGATPGARGELAHVAELGEVAEALAATAAPSVAAAADRRFHLALARLGAEHAAFDALDRVWDLLLVATGPAGPWADGLPRRPGEHAALLAAVAAGDPERAGAAARAHALAALRGPSAAASLTRPW